MQDTSVLRSLIRSIYAPWAAVALGLGVLVVALPLYLLEVGLSFTATSVVLAASGVGSFAIALPAGSGLARWGERNVVVVSIVAIAIATALTATSEDPIGLTALQLAVGAGATALRLASLTEITRRVLPHQRGRANSGMGGLRRLGGFIGPLIGGVLIDQLGFTATFLCAAAVTAIGLVPPLLDANQASGAPVADRRRNASLVGSLRRHGQLLLRSASGPFFIMTARRGRTVLLPLVAAALGVSATTVGIIVAVGTGADLLLFPVAGWLMDRFGRLRAIGPAFLLMASGLILLGFVESAGGVLAAGALIGIGNGLSAGTMMTLASDLAPADAPSQFIAGFAAIQDVGQMLGPLLVGVIADRLGLDASAFLLAAVLLVGLGLIIATIGETAQPA